MRIKRIEIIGFKSFCDRTVLHFGAEITAVVGPNGCGKSNIVDAIRWCMGEQSAKHLRGKGMEDVIFAGSDTRGPAAMAEVSLTFEDVGFSHETLELALGTKDPEDRSGSSRIGVDPPGPEAGAEQTSEAPEEELPEEAPGAQAAPQGTAGAPDEPRSAAAAAAAPASGIGAAAAGGALEGAAEVPPVAASEEVAAFLSDQGPAIDFSQYSEVTITRRLFRDGTSGYFLNKTPCRLRDITDFFLGTGVGTKAYSIIEQGRVGMIVSARPQDRRLIIEEAAGITKFKTKKKAAERKLEQTRQNLLRVSDIVDELGKRLGTLKRQAQKAERYRKCKAELRDIELWIASHRYLEIAAEYKLLAATMTSTAEELTCARAELDAKDGTLVAERAELAVEERRLLGLQQEIYELENRIKLGENKIEYQRREAGELADRAAAAHAEIGELTARREAAAADLERHQRELAQLEDEMSRHDDTLSYREAAHEEARQMLSAGQKQLDHARNQISQARTELSRAEGQLDAIARRRGDAEARLARVLEETGTINERVAELSRVMTRLGDELAQLRQTRLDLGTRTESFEARKQLLAETAETCQGQIDELRADLNRRRSRLEALRKIHERYEGFARGTRAVMKQAESIGSADILGLVADVVQAPERFEVAVEAALGDRLGGVLVRSPEAGMRGIEFLKQKSAGRSAFVAPLQRPAAGGGRETSPESRLPPQLPGLIGRLVDVVVWDGVVRDGVVRDGVVRDGVVRDGAAVGGTGRLDAASLSELGRTLLDGFWVVDTLESALALRASGTVGADPSAAGHRVTLVTLDGDLVDDRGVISGGSREAEGAGILAQKREIRELAEATEQLDAQLADATAHLVATKGELTQVTRTLEALRKESHDGDIAIMGHDKDLARYRSEYERVRERVAQLNGEQLELEERLRELAGEEVEVRSRCEAAVTSLEQHEREQLGLLEGVSDGQARLEELAQLLTEAKVRVAQLGEKRASLEAATLRLEAASRDLAARMAKLDSGSREDLERAAALREEAAGLESELGTLREQRRGRAETLESGRNSYEQRVGEMQLAELSMRELRSRCESLTSRVSATELRLANLGSSRSHLEESVAERYGIVLARQIYDFHLRPRVGDEEHRRLAELKQQLDRMGTDINLTAIEEYEEISQRHTFLDTQRADLENAVDQLERAITKINRTSRQLFTETFQAVNAKFQEVFPNLFRGGRAELQLTGGEDDILEAGVEIVAQPPGKKNSTVDQLSGGEKALTAVALIFAIFLIKPSPFCILDEVDAPLDDVNVDRYNELVRMMTDRSQFIVITHNKRTMEIAHQLYGVTMQEPGVSKIVSVNLNRIDTRKAAA
jgi:chromosome segregation protein